MVRTESGPHSPEDPVPVKVVAAPVALPVARPLGSQVLARPGTQPLNPALASGTLARTEPTAIFSAVAGVTAIIPFASQVAGLGLGFLALHRIGVKRRRGEPASGKFWAWTGIVSSGAALCGWLAALLALGAIGHSIGGSAEALESAFRASGVAAP